MSVLNTLPAPIIQMGLVEKLVEVQQNQPHVQQQVAQVTARQELKEEQSRVSGLDKSEDSKKVRDREAGQGGEQRRQEKRQASQEDGPEAEKEQGKTKPWSGHIVNIKV